MENNISRFGFDFKTYKEAVDFFEFDKKRILSPEYREYQKDYINEQL